MTTEIAIRVGNGSVENRQLTDEQADKLQNYKTFASHSSLAIAVIEIVSWFCRDWSRRTLLTPEIRSLARSTSQTPQQVAERLGCAESYARTLMSSGEIPSKNVGSGSLKKHWVTTLEAVLEYQEKATSPSEPFKAI
jgi:hypothetical protein